MIIIKILIMIIIITQHNHDAVALISYEKNIIISYIFTPFFVVLLQPPVAYKKTDNENIL